ncbi:uncharacterized protein [Macaca nemestrina]|uniref:uncharacterized protein isoform X9 n=1 Tax=Macaca nemestrina TaxID=9545 RepID=UPI0039B976EC
MLRCPRVNRSHWLVTLTSHFLREKELKTDSRLAVHRMYSSLHVRTQQQGTILEADSNPHQTPIAGSLILDFSAFRSFKAERETNQQDLALWHRPECSGAIISRCSLDVPPQPPE